MEICKRRSSSYDSGKTLFAANTVPNAATAAGNLTVTFSSQLNQHNQVGGDGSMHEQVLNNWVGWGAGRY